MIIMIKKMIFIIREQSGTIGFNSLSKKPGIAPVRAKGPSGRKLFLSQKEHTSAEALLYQVRKKEFGGWV